MLSICSAKPKYIKYREKRERESKYGRMLPVGESGAGREGLEVFIVFLWVFIVLFGQLFCGIDNYKINSGRREELLVQEVVIELAARPKAVSHPRMEFRMTPYIKLASPPFKSF